MWRKGVVVGVLFCAMGLFCSAQQYDSEELIARVLGVDSVEDVTQEEFERFEHLLDHPVRINFASEDKLRSSGLFSDYQIAVLLDYICNHGYVLSLAELSSIDGFNADFVSCIAPFISLDSAGKISESSGYGVRNNLSVRTSIRSKDEVFGWAYGVKYTIDAGAHLTGGLGLSRSYSAVSDYTGNVQCDFRQLHGKVILGDYNLRLGQGLALWNGMMMDNLLAPSSLMRKPTGLSRSSSFTGANAFTGAGLELGKGPMTCTFAWAFKDSFVANLSWLLSFGRVSVSHASFSAIKSSIDFAFCFNGTNVFGETAFDWQSRRISAVAGSDFKAWDHARAGVLLRYIPEEQYCIAVTSSFQSLPLGSLGVSVNGICYPVPKKGDEGYSTQLKARIDWEYSFSESSSLKVRLTDRFRTWGHPNRFDLRADYSHVLGRWTLMSRINLLMCESIAGLWFVESSSSFSDLTLYLRQGVFLVDDWDDRIYVYERDAPGSFNVPAMYGRGLWGSMVARWEVTRWARLYVRAGYTSYVFMKTKKPGRAELKCQCVFKF